MSDHLPDPRQMHQPPNPERLRIAPPADAVCASIRGFLRDFADGELDLEQRREVEEHVHGCHLCSVELSRAEHEVVRLKRGFEAIAADERTRVAPLGAGFAARVVDRLLLDETAVVPLVVPAVVPAAAAGDRPGDAGSDGAVAATPTRTPARSSASRASNQTPAVLFTVAALLFVVFGAIALFFDEDKAPSHSPRLVLTRASGARGPNGLLTLGDGLGEKQALAVDSHGLAEIDWHDDSSRAQPAATLKLDGQGSLRLEDGAPRLLAGTMRVQTNRPVTIPVGDGTNLQLGIGDYVIAADAAGPTENYGSDVENPLASAPADLRLEVEVLHGDSARIVGTQVENTLVQAGSVGVYESGTGTVVRSVGGQVATVDPIARGGATANPVQSQPTIAAFVHEPSGVPSVGAALGVAYAAHGTARYGSGTTNANGAFVASAEFGCDSDFMILKVEPAAPRLELGMRAPDAYRVVRQGAETRCAASLVLDVSPVLSGVVVDESGAARYGVRALPCIVDEIFGSVLPLTSRLAFTDEEGRYLIHQLPVSLPPHQFLAVVFAHPNLKVRVVPVPARGSAAALLPMPQVVMKGLQQVRLVHLPAFTTVHVLEDVDVLPHGALAWHRTFVTDGWGQVPIAAIGNSGDFWLRSGPEVSPVLQKFQYLDGGTIPRYEPSSLQLPLGDHYEVQTPLDGTDLLIPQTYRHQHFLSPLTSSAPTNRALQVVDALNRAVPDAQVFATAGSGPAGQAVPQFLGFTSAIGVASLDVVAGGGDLVVIAADGSSAFVTAPQQAFGITSVTLQGAGRVVVAPGLRPSGNLSDQFLPIRLERVGASISGLHAPLYRFACEATGWEVGGIPPGTYRAYPGDSASNRLIIVQPGGFATLQ